MKPLNIEFAPQPDRWAGALKAAAAVVAIAIAADMALLGFTYSRLDWARGEYEVLQQRSVSLQAKLDRGRRATPYDSAALGAAKASGFALEDALAALEDATIPGVQLVTVEFDLLSGTGRAELEAPTPAEMEKYLQGLGGEDANDNGWRVVKIGANTARGVPLPAGVPGPLPPGMIGSIAPAKVAIQAPGIGLGTLELVWRGY